MFYDSEEEEAKDKAFEKGLYQRTHKFSSVKRFLTDGEIVEFTKVLEETGRNVKYEINNDAGHEIWFSQLVGIFYAPDLDISGFSGLTLKGKDIIPLCSITDEEFWSMTRGKKFKVSIDRRLVSAMNWDSPYFMKMFAGDSANRYILNHIKNKQWDDLN